MARAAIKTGVLSGVYIGANKVLGVSKFTISGEAAKLLAADEFGYAVDNKIPDGTVDPGTITIPDVLRDPTDTTGQNLLDAQVASGVGYGPDEIKFMRDATSYYTVDTGGKIYVVKGAGGGMDRSGLEKTSYEFQISGALLVIKPSLVSIAITGTTTKAAGLTSQLVATGTYSSGPTAVLTTQVIWASSDQTKAIVTAGGLVGAIAAGTPNITATLLGIVGTTVFTVT